MGKSTSQCLDENADCKTTNEGDYKCLCRNTHFNNSGICSARQGYGYYCSSQDICQSNFPCARAEKDVKRCLCPERYFRHVSSCLAVERLRVSNITMDGAYMETEINVRWTRPLNRPNLIYSVSLSDSSISDFSNKTFAKLTGKTPGTTYIVYVTTETKKEEFGITVINTASRGIPFYTKPARPGKLTRNEYPANDVNLEFVSSAGKVDWYHVKLLPSNSRPIIIISKSGNTQSVRFPNLTEGKFYNISIVASIKKNDTGEMIYSTEQTDTFRVKSEVSGPVSKLVIAGKNSRWISVEWSMPSEPKGFVSGYILQAIDHVTSKCESEIIWTCRFCNSSQLDIQNLETCTRSTSRDMYVNQVQNASYIFRSNVTDLVPDTHYTLRVQAVNENGIGSVTELSTTTEQEHAQNLKNLTVSKMGLGTLCVNWTPGQRTGPTRYNVTWEESADLDSGIFLFKGSHIVVGYENRSYTIQGLLSYWTYRINVHAATDIGPSPSPTTVTAQTLDSLPGPVQNLTIHQPDTTAQFLHLVFKCPDERERNGPIESFEFNSSVIWSESTQPILPNGTVNIEADCDFDVTVKVTAETNYSFSVYAKTSNYHGLLSTQFAFVKPKVPLLAEHKTVLVTVDVTRSTETSVSVDVCRCLVDTRQGQITMAGLVVCKKSDTESCQPEPGPRNRTYYESLLTWKQFKTAGETGRYRTTPEYFHDIVYNESSTIKLLDHARRDDQAYFTYIIGSENCTQRSSAEFCNGYLPSNTQLYLIVFACTRAGCSESSHTVQIKTKFPEENKDGEIVGGTLAVLIVIGIVVTAVILVLRYKRRASSQDVQHHVTDDNIRIESRTAELKLTRLEGPAVPLYLFAKYYDQMHQESPSPLVIEFEKLQVHNTAELSTHVGCLTINSIKNRSQNVLPYDHTRVKVRAFSVNEDYINASYVAGMHSPCEYIATQCPLVSTMSDFWTMVCEQRSGLIVMLAEKDTNEQQVCKYWPEKLSSYVSYGDVRVEMTDCSALDTYTVRKMTVSMAGKDDLVVTHLCLAGWTNNGYSLALGCLVDVIEIVRKGSTHSEGPVVVHCSAGIGPTGIFIALDILTQFVDTHDLGDLVDVSAVVKGMLKCRPCIVQTQEQYIFIHSALRAIIARKTKPLQGNIACYENAGTWDVDYEKLYAIISDGNIYDMPENATEAVTIV